jgi:hypothetical protein
LGQARWIVPSNPQGVTSEYSSTPIDVYRRRVELRHTLATVEAAIALRDERGSDSSSKVNLEGLREDLLVALWLTEIVLAKG